MMMMMTTMMNQDCLRKIVIGLCLHKLLLLCVRVKLDSGNDDDHDQDKMDEKGKAVLDKIRMSTHEDYLKVQITDC